MNTAKKFAIYQRYVALERMGWVQGLGWLTRNQITCLYYDTRGVPPVRVADNLIHRNLCDKGRHEFGKWGLFYHVPFGPIKILARFEDSLVRPTPIEAYRYRKCLHGCGLQQRQSFQINEIEDFRDEPRI